MRQENKIEYSPGGINRLNEPIFVESAQALALRPKGIAATDSARVDYLSLLCHSRLPTDAEKKVLLDFLQSQRNRVAEWMA